MIVTAAISSTCFGPQGVRDVEARHAAEILLDALRHNAIVLTSERDFPDALLKNVAALPVKLGQQLSIQAAEFMKTAHRAVRVVSASATDNDVIQELLIAARRGADGVVCSTELEASAVRTALRGRPIDICVLADYPRTRMEAMRRKFMETVEMHTLSTADCDAVISRAVRGGGKIIIADRMLGTVAKDGIVTTRLERFARGVVYVARNAVGQGAAATVEVEIITVGGGTGARSGFVDPAKARGAIQNAVQNISGAEVIANLKVTIKSDTSPPVFQDRLLACGGRCWVIRHGIDNIGGLALDTNRRSPTYIDPDNAANRKLLGAIVNLKNA